MAAASAEAFLCQPLLDLIVQEADLFQLDPDLSHFTFMHHLALQGQRICIDEVAKVISEDDLNALLNAQDDSGATPIMVAALQNGVFDDFRMQIMIRGFVQLGADLEVKNEAGETVLVWTCGAGMDAVVEYLLDQGADINAVSD